MAQQFICSAEIGDEFTIVDQIQSFDAAQSTCEGLDATLARISTIDEYFFVLKVGVQLENTELAGWIGSTSGFLSYVSLGIQAPEGQGNDAAAYQFTDNFDASTSFFTKADQFPWAPGVPSDASRTCAAMVLNVNDGNLWVQDVCTSNNKPICRRPCSNLTPGPTPTPSIDDPVDVGNNLTGSRDDEIVDSLQMALLGIMAIAIVAFIAISFYVKRELRQMKNMNKALVDLEVL